MPPSVSLRPLPYSMPPAASLSGADVAAAVCTVMAHRAQRSTRSSLSQAVRRGRHCGLCRMLPQAQCAVALDLSIVYLRDDANAMKFVIRCGVALRLQTSSRHRSCLASTAAGA